MADLTTGQGFLADIGLTDLSLEEARSARRRNQFGLGVQQAVQGINNTPGLSAPERDLRKVGAIFGNFFGTRKALGGGNLTDPEEAGITAVQSAQAKLTELKRVTPGMSQEMASEKFKMILAGELAMVGQVQKSMEVGKAAEQEFRARKTQQLQLKRLGIDVDRAGIGKTLDEGKATRDLRGQVNPVWPKGATREDEAIMGFMQNDGTMISADGEEIDLGDYSIFPPPTPTNGGKPLTANDLGISDREQKEIRDQVLSIGSMARGAVDMRDALAEVAARGAGVNIMDGTGKITGGAAKLMEIFGGVSRAIGASLDVQDSDGRSQGILSNGPAAAKWTEKNFTDLDDRLFDLVPERLKDDERSRAKYYSALTRLTFAQARSNEPGARQLSDEDFKRALTQMAGNASDPEAFRGVMENNMKESVAAMRMRTEIIGPDRMRLIVNDRGMNAMNQELERFDRAFKKEFIGEEGFGSAANPSEALTGGNQSISTSGATITFLD